jgi:uncharacterized membrane protein YvbJ
MAKFCTYCDTERPDLATTCEKCGRELKHVEETKQNRVILGKIAVKNVEYENNTGWGPIVLIIVGLVFTIALIGIPCMALRCFEWVNLVPVIQSYRGCRPICANLSSGYLYPEE